MIRSILGSLVVAAVVASASPAAVPTGVLAGRVFREATTIQCIRAPCLEPAVGVVLTIVRGKKVVRVTTTDERGTFLVRLRAGSYKVRGPGLVRVGLGNPSHVEVRAGRVTRLSLRIAGKGGGAIQSGVSGLVVKSPIRPVCEEGVPCSAPAAGIALAFSSRGVVVARALTSKTGVFRVPLAPGTYLVASPSRFPFGGIRPTTVTVAAGSFTVVKFAIDTGIR